MARNAANSRTNDNDNLATPANSLNITPAFPGESLNESEREEDKFGYKLRNDSRIITDLTELDGLDQSEDCDTVNDEFERSESSSEEEKKVSN